jgi:general secretion pathway protein D
MKTFLRWSVLLCGLSDYLLSAEIAQLAPVPELLRARPAEAVAVLVARGRGQYLADEPVAARHTLEQALAADPSNAEAQFFINRLHRESAGPSGARVQASAAMLGAVDRAWQRPSARREPEGTVAASTGPSPLQDKLHRIIIPSVNFSGLEIGRVINTLSALTEEYDLTGASPKGVNLILVDPSMAHPLINLTLRNLSLKRVLDFITESVGYQYEVQADAVIIRPGGEQSALTTQFFAIARSTVLRMIGQNRASGGSRPSLLALPVGNELTMVGEGQAIRDFLQLAGVIFEGVVGSTLAFDGSQLIVTQTPRNLERIQNILTRYNEVRQVEIEAKFLEVQQGALEELGVQWNLGKKATQHSGATVSNYQTANRSLAQAFTNDSGGGRGSIVRGMVGATTTTSTLDATGAILDSTLTSSTGSPTPDVPILDHPPSIPGTNNLGVIANPLATISGIIGEFNLNAVVRALSQKAGTELLSAPKLTVLSGNLATITVAQELRYPQSFGQVQSQVGTGSASGGGSAGVAITAGTPQEFTTRNVGVELKVTPTVEEDDYSISLDLNPKVTEFEGFVEYGGQSIAISGGTTVTVPSGFFQPIFGVREMSTKVTIWDGATLVMGGLTREDVKNVSDKVPVMGNLPGLGRFFRSKGESTQKRNLLIFVTANLVSPGGSLKKQAVAGIPAGTLYQNPTIVTPQGLAERVR